jgi:DNA-binding GntR family transcriptional regulator
MSALNHPPMTLRTKAYDAFTQRLLDRQLEPGQFVTQKQLASLTGFPLGAIREMIPRLEAEGLIRAIARRGLQVAQPDVQLVREAFELREIIEQAALARFVATAPDHAIRQLRTALEAVRRGAEHGITPQLLAQAQATDWGFHDVLVDSLANRLLSDIHRVNAIRVRMMMPARVTLSEATLPPAIAEHAAIIAGLERRDAGAAAAALRAHLASARRRALAIDPPDDAGVQHATERSNLSP